MGLLISACVASAARARPLMYGFGCEMMTAPDARSRPARGAGLSQSGRRAASAEPQEMMPSRGGHAPRAPHCVRSMGERRPPVRACLLLLAALLPALAAAQPVGADRSQEEELPADRYFANDSLLEQPVSCSDEEKECLRYNRLLLPSHGRCYALGQKVGGCRIAVDRCLWEREGQLRAECAPTDLCRPLNANKVRMAFDGRCLKTREVLGARDGMRDGVRYAARALLPAALCALLPLLHPRLASPAPTTHVPLRNPYATPPAPHNYFANDSLLGQPVACTDEEKECLRYNRIYSPLLERCYALGDGPNRCRWAVDPCAYERAGHLRGTCAASDLCTPYSRDHFKMAFDGQCVEISRLQEVCGPEPVNIVPHFFGDSECARPQLLAPDSPVYVSQPEERGRCAFPNLRHDLTAVVADSHFRECSEEQSVCFAEQKVWLNATRRCYGLFEEEPCGSGSRVVLDREAWEAGAVEATCAPLNPCANLSATHRLMAFDRRCYAAAAVLRALCPGGVLLPNAFGEMACATRDYYRHVIELRSVRPRACELTHRVAHDQPPPGTRAMPES
ncbi:Protein of unknown function [Gryllus bimaculatus]|nr:Protein of unknown function [Gryllus bimaculatus]